MTSNKLSRFWAEYRSTIIFIALMFVFRSAVADWSHVPSGSMQPTIKIGDQLLINKMAYDIRLPFTHISLKKLADPARGDIVIFDSEVVNKRLVKRIIGLPGDVIAMKDNRLLINGVWLDHQDIDNNSEQYTEQLFNVEHKIKLAPSQSALANFQPVKVPDDQYLVLGDDRDNSADSRVIGFVTRTEIVGKTEMVAFSLNYDNYFLPRNNRYLANLNYGQ